MDSNDLGRPLRGNPLSSAAPMEPVPVSTKGFNRAQGRADVFPPRNCDPEVAAIMDELSKLQTMLTLQMRQGPVWMAAADLVQRTRVLIVERCFRPQMTDKDIVISANPKSGDAE
jgi:hypothetical protein